MKRSLLILFLSAITFGVSAQDKEQKNSSFLMFVHGGYAYSPNKEGKGLTSYSADYAKKMSSGACWNLQLFYRYKKFVVGMMYSGFASSGKLEIPSVDVSSRKNFTNSDKLLTTYIAPQFGMHIPAGESFVIDWTAGFGGMVYRNNSIAYEQPRVVKGSNLGINLNAKVIYKFTEHFGLSAEIMAIWAGLRRSHVNYNEDDIKVVYFPKLPVNQYTFSLGLTYSL